MAQMIKNLPAMQETQFQSLGQEDPLEEKMATHSNILAWEIPWTEEPGGLQSMESQRAGHDWVKHSIAYIYIWTLSLIDHFSWGKHYWCYFKLKLKKRDEWKETSGWYLTLRCVTELQFISIKIFLRMPCALIHHPPLNPVIHTAQIRVFSKFNERDASADFGMASRVLWLHWNSRRTALFVQDFHPHPHWL